VKDILDQIAAFDAVLSAGHLHISEIWPLFEEAEKRGVKRRLVQHPTYTIDATLADIADLTKDGAFVEHSLCMFIEESRFQKWTGEELAAAIEAGGTEQTILGSDLGQIDNPTPVTGFRHVIRLCIELGFDDATIRRLTSGNAARLLGLPA
jgi:microsomal dipeptidase-like Zn-dependent dipeptidase